MIAALAFVPVDDVATTFRRLNNRAPAAMQSIFEYFEENYVLGRLEEVAGIRTILFVYENYEIMEYLETIAHNIVISNQ